MITRTFKLCLNAGSGSAPYINVNQYDEGETWLFELYSENGERYIPSSGAIVGVKSDGHGIVNTGTVDSEGRVVITETQQMTASAGRAIYELSIDGLTHGTANFIVAVERKPTDDAVMSDSDLSLIQEAVNSSQEILDIIGDTDLEEVVKDDIDAWLDAHPEATTTVEDGAITEAKLNDSVKTGVFEDMTVGTSLAVMNDEGVTDNLAYKFRQTGGDAVRELDEIVGGTIAWNQIIQTIDSEHWEPYSASNISTSFSDGVLTATINNVGASGYINGVMLRNAFPYNVISGHKYLQIISIYTSFQAQFGGEYLTSYFTPLKTVPANTWTTIERVVSASSSSVKKYLTYPVTGSEISVGDSYKIKDAMLIDLTQMFGSTVADAIYAMEQSSAGSGVAYFRSLFPNAYYAYNSGELVSVEGLSSHDTVGFNQWDEEWEVGAINLSTGENISLSDRIRNINYIPVIPNTTYFFGIPSTTSGNIYFYNADKSFISQVFKYRETFTTPANCCFVRFVIQPTYGTTYNHDICINISSSENGTYKPYQKHTYPLDSTLTLRGVPKWSNGLYFDGDIYRYDGSVSRRYGVVDLGSLTWVYDDATSYKHFRPTGTTWAQPKYQGGLISTKFIGTTKTYSTIANMEMCVDNTATSPVLRVRDDSFTNATAFKNSVNGVMLVYELATPTSETADPYQQYQICDGKGTEEYVSETVTPVGHSTFYPVDIVSKVNKLPSDFSTLIAPTEEGFKATRNYTVNDLLIVNNVLYKVTANIANGGTITVNTNVQQTTLGALIKALS